MNKNQCQGSQSNMKPPSTIFLLLCFFIGQTTARYIYFCNADHDPILVFFCCRMSEMEEHEFIQDYLTWIKPGFDKEALTILNFLNIPCLFIQTQ